MHIQATVKRVKGQCGFGRLVRIDILATLGLAFYIPAGEPEIQALIVCNTRDKINIIGQPWQKIPGIQSDGSFIQPIPLFRIVLHLDTGAVDKVASENQQWEFEQKKRRSLASFRVPYQPLQVQ
ncbi:hypothetical protein B5F35_15480, partial [Anaeromassilibacillus sp. An200]